MGTEIKRCSPASKRVPRASNRKELGLLLGVARLTDDVAERLELGRVEASQKLRELLQGANHALLQGRAALRRARHEHRAAVAAVRDAAHQRLVLQSGDRA